MAGFSLHFPVRFGRFKCLFRHYPQHVSHKAQQNKSCFLLRRTYLSAAYSCEEAWKERLDEDLIRCINPTNYYLDLNKQFISDKKITAVELDLFANSIVDTESLDDLEDLVHRFRRTPNTIYFLPSTAHAVVRTFMQFGQYNALMRILNGRQNYGIFPDYYCCNLMMDTFLMQKNFRNATKVAILMMLQEDFGNVILKHLSIHSCLSYLKSPQPEPWETEPPPTPPEEPPEQVIIRLSYLPPNYFDDHFDLKEPQKLIGKTLAMLGKDFEGELGRTCQLIGHSLHEKWDRVEKFVKSFVDDKSKIIYKEGVHKVQNIIENIADDESGTRGTVTEKLMPLLERLSTAAVDGEMTDVTESLLKNAVQQHESKDIEEQIACYRHWAQVRVDENQKRLVSEDRDIRLKRIQEMKEDLQKREQLLFFFENFEVHAMNVEKYDEVANEIKAKTKVKEDDVYIPPDVTYKPEKKT